jgi:hypothetical protein
MASISSNTGSALTSPRMLWADTLSWVGAVVPGNLDDVTISGFRTTINQGNISKWSGTITITVASTSGFPTTGYFYTYTNFGDYVKVLYTGSTGTTFTGCSIDYTDPLCNWKYSTVTQTLSTNYYNYGSVIGNGYYVYSPAPLITIPANYQANVSTLTISNGGILNIEPGGNLTANNFITLRDGRFIGRANTTNNSIISINRTEASGVGYLQTENYAMSILDVDGGETRSYGTTNTAIAVGDAIINITPVLGSFAVGDEIAIYDTSYANTRVSFYAYRDIPNDWRLVRDEGFDVAGVVGNQIALARRNGARGRIKGVATSGSQKVLTVDKDEFINQMNFKPGDIVVINNTKYTLADVKESELDLAAYDFQTGSTLADFLTDYASSTGPWAIDSYGAYPTTNNYNTIVHKQIFRRDVIVEAEISPLNQYFTGSRGTDQFGLLFSYDPAFRNGTRSPQDGTMTGRFSGKDAGSTPYLTLGAKYASPGTDNWIDLSIDPTFRTVMRGPHTERVELRNGILKAFINGEQIGERFEESGGHRGLVGWYSWNNTSTRVKSFRVKATTVDLYITTTDNFTINDIAYESGAEYAHTSGQRILKIASKVTSPGTHDDLSFNYRGLYSANSWPMCINYNGTNTNNYLWNLNTHTFTYAHEVYMDLGTAANCSITVDLAQSQTFTHVSLTPRMDDAGSATGAGFRGVQVLGSNDNSSFTLLYGPTDDVKRYCNPQSDTYPWYQQMGHYYTGSQTYRYVKVIMNGHNGSSNPTLNRLIGVGVYNFASNNYTIVVNNASDFANGDVITVLNHANYISNDDFHHYQAVKAGQNPDTYFYTSNTHSTIVNKVGNTLFLDRPINYGYVEGRESVVKINRNFKMLGYYDVNGGIKYQKPYFKVNLGSNLCQIRLIKNWQFYNVGSSRTSGSGFNRGVDVGNQDVWNPSVIDGISVIGYNNSDANGLTMQNASTICRNGYVGNVRDYRPYYTPNRSGTATYNMKMNSLYRFRPESLQNKITNYNEVAGARQWDVTVVYDCDFWASPVPVEFRRNNLHGIYQIPAFIPGSGSIGADFCGQPIKNEFNLLYSTNLAAFNNGFSSNAWVPVGMDIHADHPGTRVSWQRNEGYIGWYNTAADSSSPIYQLKDFMRAGYDYSGVVYDSFIKKNGTDYIRNYRRTDDSYYPRLQFSIYSKSNVPFQIYIEFQYRMPFKLDRLGASPVNFSRLYLLAVQNGDFLSGFNPLQLPIPSDGGWVTYSTTITTFASIAGTAYVSLSGRATQQTVDFRNARAFVKTNNPSEIITLGNTFDVNKYQNATNDVKYMTSISAPANILKGIKL